MRNDSRISWRHLGYLAAQAVVVPIVLSGCSRSAQTPPVVTEAPAATSAARMAPPRADRPPADLVLVGESAEGLFDAARSSQWQTATAQLQTLNEAASRLPTGLPKRTSSHSWGHGSKM